MKHADDAVAWGGNLLAAAFTALQTEEIFQVVSLVLTIVATSITIFVKLIPLIVKFLKWLKKSLADGKITDEELKEGEEIAKEISSHVEETKK